MKRQIKAGMTLLSLLFFISPITSHAGPGLPGHSHEAINQNQAQHTGKGIVSKLISRHKIEGSWSQAKFVNAEKKRFGKQDEWIVSFSNAAASDKTKQTLYIFLSTEGHYLAANFTGK